MLELRGICKAYAGTPLLVDVTLDIAPGEVVALLGSSGSGKSTLLQVIAGVAQPDAGRVEWDRHDITGEPTHRRRFGMVFQDALLFPHLDVAGNVGYGLRIERIPRGEVAARVRDLLRMVDLDGFESRRVDTLSGGEAQRVALARALAPEPRLLLLDEAFGALDRDLRLRLAAEVRDLLHRLGTPALHVTHDLEEARLVADRVLRLRDRTVTE